MTLTAHTSPNEAKHRILVVDDEPEMATVIEQGLARRGYHTTQQHDADSAWELLAREDFDVVVTDLNMRGMNGVELTERIAKNRTDVPVIVITAFGSLETATAVLRAGAYDFLTKPFEIDQLVVGVERAIQNRALRAEVKRLRAEVARSRPKTELIGESPPIRKLIETLAQVAETDTTVLITGETGTGKELVARALHELGKRKAGPFVTFRAAAPETLVEGELFGQASGGTLFLDEIADMSLAMQAKVLRALEERPAHFDARIVAATNRDLESLVESGAFRGDLYYRINVVQLALPPLRARGGDVLALAQELITRYAEPMGKKVRGFSTAVGERLLAYAWPGNVRELQNCIERALALARFEELTVEDLPPKVRDYKPSFVVVATEDPTDLATMEEVERRYIQRVMEAVGQNKTQAAKILGFDRTTLYRKLERDRVSAKE